MGRSKAKIRIAYRVELQHGASLIERLMYVQQGIIPGSPRKSHLVMQ